MPSKKRFYVLILAVVIILLFTATPVAYGAGGGTGIEETSTAPEVVSRYDLNGNCIIDRPEAIRALRDYSAGEISRGDAISILSFYSSGEQVGACESDRPELYRPISPPMAPAYIYWRWKHKQEPFREIVTDFTIHNDVGDWSDQHGYYLILLRDYISDVGFHVGLQTDAFSSSPPYRRGKAIIFSKWGTDDLANAKIADPIEGWAESARNGIGVRRSYDWAAGNYRVRIAPDGLDLDGEWFGLWITNLDTSETTWAGSLKFPLRDGTAKIASYSSTTIELYGVSRIRPIDIPQWHVSVKRPLGDGNKSLWGFTRYPYDDSDNALLNSDVRYDYSEDRAHFLIGAATERTTPPERLYFSIPPDSYYKQFVSVNGVTVKANESVDPDAVEAGADIVTAMLSGREDIAQCMPREEAELAIIPKDEVWTTLPEFAHFAGRRDFTGRRWDSFELRGSGGVVGLPVATVGEEQLLGTFGPQHPRYPFRGMIAVHEFAHSIQNLCFTEEDHEEWVGFYLEARSAGLYPGSHMMTNVGEFFATFTTGYFEVTYELDYGSTRETLKTRFPEVSLALEEIYGGETLPVEYRTRLAP